MIELVMDNIIRGTLSEDQVMKSEVLSHQLPFRQTEDNIIIDLSNDEDIFPESVELFAFLCHCGDHSTYMRELSLREIKLYLMFSDKYQVSTDLLHHIHNNVKMYPSLAKVKLMDSMIGVSSVTWTEDVYRRLMSELVDEDDMSGLQSSTLEGIMRYMIGRRMLA
jgi:hypothetical protein